MTLFKIAAVDDRVEVVDGRGQVVYCGGLYRRFIKVANKANASQQGFALESELTNVCMGSTTRSPTTLQFTTLVSEETMNESSDIALIVGVVVGGVVLLAVASVAVAVDLSRRRRKSVSSNELPMAATAGGGSASNYGVAPPPREDDAPPPVRTSEYGPISARGEYASMRADTPPQSNSNYGRIQSSPSNYTDRLAVPSERNHYDALVPHELASSSRNHYDALTANEL